MKRTFQNDYEFGTRHEVDTLTALRTLNPTLVRTHDKYDPFDFVNDTFNVFVELKTRNNTKNKYPTTMISYSKILHAKKNPDRQYYFAFKFVDGLYYIKYDASLFETFAVGEGGRFDRGFDEINQYIYIPVENLSMI